MYTFKKKKQSSLKRKLSECSDFSQHFKGDLKVNLKASLQQD